MSDFSKISTTHPLRVVLVGAGSMGQQWITAVNQNSEAKLVGIVDVAKEMAEKAKSFSGQRDVLIGTDFLDVAKKASADVILNVTTPGAHLDVSVRALLNGYQVLTEKPLTEDLKQAHVVVAAAQFSGNLIMVSQSRRWNPDAFEFRQMIDSLGAKGILNCLFFKAIRFGGFRDLMDSPLILDMAIHMFDNARFLLDSNAKTVYCHEFNPSWSWYKGDSGASTICEMDNGAIFTFTGNWSSPGAETSWNSEWRYSGELGSATWDGDNRPVRYGGVGFEYSKPFEEAGISVALAQFIDALRTEKAPMGEVHENLESLAIVEAALESSRTKKLVIVDDLLNHALANALKENAYPELKGTLDANWAKEFQR